MEKTRLLLRGLMVLGILLTCSPLFGLLGTAFGMMHSFQHLGSTGISDPKALSADVHIAFISSALGLALAPVGIVLIIVSLIASRSLERPVSAQLPPPFPPTQG